MPAPVTKHVRYFRLKEKAAPHYKGGKMYTPGMVMESRSDLCKLYPNKFEEVAGPKSTIAPAPTPPKEEVPANTEETASNTETTVDPGKVPGGLGEDVTAQFPLAEPAGVMVFRHGAWYQVADKDDPNVAMNPKALNKKGVEEFLKTLINE